MVSLALEAGTETATAVFAITWTCQQLLATAKFLFFFLSYTRSQEALLSSSTRNITRCKKRSFFSKTASKNSSPHFASEGQRSFPSPPIVPGVLSGRAACKHARQQAPEMMPTKPATLPSPETSLFLDIPPEKGPLQGLSRSKAKDVSVLSLFNSNSSILQPRNTAQGKRGVWIFTRVA